MAAGALAYHMVARHGQAIDRLKRDMAAEESPEWHVDFLGYEVANFTYAFLIASGNAVSSTDRHLRDELQEAVLTVLAKHGIDQDTFVVRPELG